MRQLRDTGEDGEDGGTVLDLILKKKGKAIPVTGRGGP
jgi:hypothetical protein